MGTSFRDFAAVFFHLSDCVRFSTCVGLLPVRVFPFFLFLYVVFLILLGTFSWVFLYCACLLSGSDLSSTPYIGLLCLLTKCILLIPAKVTRDSDSDGMISPIKVKRS